MLRFFILFIVILVTLFTAELTQPVQSAVVLPWTTALVHTRVHYARPATLIPTLENSATAGDLYASGPTHCAMCATAQTLTGHKSIIVLQDRTEGEQTFAGSLLIASNSEIFSYFLGEFNHETT